MDLLMLGNQTTEDIYFHVKDSQNTFFGQILVRPELAYVNPRTYMNSATIIMPCGIVNISIKVFNYKHAHIEDYFIGKNDYKNPDVREIFPKPTSCKINPNYKIRYLVGCEILHDRMIQRIDIFNVNNKGDEQ